MNTIMTKDEFDKKYISENTVVRCLTKELAEEFLRKADEFGYRWQSGDRYVDGNYYYRYEEDTCYNIATGRYKNINYYRLEGFNIVEFNKFCQEVPHPL